MSRKIDELNNPDGCLGKAADDEPIFVLRANDPCAPAIVRRWADDYLIYKRENSHDGCLTHAQLSKAQEARGLANEMESYRDFHDLGKVNGGPRRSVLDVLQMRVFLWKLAATLEAALAAGVISAAVWRWLFP